MKKTDLEKLKAMKLAGKLAQSGTPPRYGVAPPAAVDRREQRRRDQAAGLVPFATKLPADLITALHFAAHSRGITTGELLVQVLSANLPGYHAGTDSQEG